MPGLPHTRTAKSFSHCAFTAKVQKFAPMMAAQGYDVIHYGVGLPEGTGWADAVELMSPSEQESLFGYDPEHSGSQFVGRDANVGHPAFQKFNARLHLEIAKRLAPDDIICLPFGHGHGSMTEWGAMFGQCIETGIGYPTCLTGWRIYESYAWMHWHLGREDRSPWISEWVIPNYFETEDWSLRPLPPQATDPIVYFGRITQAKGLNAVLQLALARPDQPFILCGQGDPTPWLQAPNISYREPLAGLERAALFHEAQCVLMPTEFVEPFGGVAIEAMLTGTPVLTVDCGGFSETIPEHFRCHTEGDWHLAIADALHRYASPAACRALQRSTQERYGLAPIGARYDNIFQKVPAMRRTGWAQEKAK